MRASSQPSWWRRYGGPTLVLAARLFVGAMFAYLAIMKLLDPFEFLKQLRLYEMFPEHPPYLINVIAVVVPWLEMLCALGLLLGVLRKGAAVLITGMLLFFAPILLIRAWGLYTAPGADFASFCDVRFDCGCGTGEVYICSKMVENTLLLIGAVIVLFSRSRWLCLDAVFDRWLGRPRAAGDPAPAGALQPQE